MCNWDPPCSTGLVSVQLDILRNLEEDSIVGESNRLRRLEVREVGLVVVSGEDVSTEGLGSLSDDDWYNYRDDWLKGGPSRGEIM